MKKIYQNPEIKIVKVQPTLMQTTSELRFGDGVGTAAGAESRRSGSFFDDEDDDY